MRQMQIMRGFACGPFLSKIVFRKGGALSENNPSQQRVKTCTSQSVPGAETCNIEVAILHSLYKRFEIIKVIL